MPKFVVKTLCILLLSLLVLPLSAQRRVPKRTPYITQIYTLRIDTKKAEKRVEKKLKRALGKAAKKVDAVREESRLYITFDHRHSSVEKIRQTLDQLQIPATLIDRSGFTLKQPCCR